MNDRLTFAVPKGRILDEALPVMARAGVVPEAGFHDKANRALCFATTRDDLRLIRVRAFDVATFVFVWAGVVMSGGRGLWQPPLYAAVFTVVLVKGFGSLFPYPMLTLVF